MPTTVTKTIAQTSSPTVPDYTSLAAWFAACPANLVTADQIWRGECLDQGKFTASVNFSGITTDSTRYVVLTCASGASFSDKAGVRSTALTYNSTTGNGVAIETTGSSIILNCSINYTQFIGLKVKTTGYAKAVKLNGTSMLVDKCIVATNASNTTLCEDVGSTHIWRNSLFLCNGGSGFLVHGNIQYCTVIQLGSAGATTAFDTQYNQAIIKDTAVFGFNTFTTGTPAAGSDYNATDKSTAVTGAHNQTSLTFASQFVNSANDFRSVSTGSLKNGTPIGGVTTDISGYSRDVTTPYIGAWEATAASSSFTASPSTIPANHSGNITLTLTGTGEAWNAGTTVFTVSGVTGVTKVSQNITGANAATLVVTTSSGTGTLTIAETVTGTDNTTISVATATLGVSPTTGTVSTAPTITLTGANTLWTTETAAGLFTVSGVSGCSIGTPTVTTNTAATATLTLGVSTGTLTITDTSTGATTTFAVNSVSGGITVTTPKAWQVYQRNGSNQANIAISGTYTGGPGTLTIEASFNGGAYATIATGSGGTFSGTLTNQAAGRGTLTVRFVLSTGISTTVTNVGIGDNFIVAGQSNAVGLLAALQTYSGAPKASAFGGGALPSTTWQEGNDPFYTSVSSGSIWPIVATHVMGYTGYPIAFIQTAIGGKSLDNGTPSPFYFTKREPSTGAAGTGYTNLTNSVTASGINGAVAILWVQCENDIDGNVPYDTYLSSQIRYAFNANTDLTSNPVFIPCIRGYVSNNSAYTAIRNAIAQGTYASTPSRGPVSDINLARMGGIGTGGANELHWQSQDDADTMGARFAAAIISYMSGTPDTGRGPRVVSIQHNSARTIITVTFDQILKTGLTFDTSIWTVTGNGSAATISSIGYNSSDTRAVDITLSSAASLPILVSLAAVAATAGKVFPLGPNYTLPNATVINLPADPFVNRQSGLSASSPPPPPPPPGGSGGANLLGKGTLVS